MNKQIEFVSNTPDGMRCVPAVFKMLYKYFLNQDLSWEEIDKLMGVIPGKGVWTFLAITDLAKKGVKIEHIEPVDYKRLYKEGTDYLYEVVGKETADYYINKSNLPHVLDRIPEFIEKVKVDVRKSSIDEVVEAVKRGKLVSIEVDAARLNGTKKFSLHYVLIYDFDGEDLIFHDPGLPPLNGRRVSVKDLDKAFSFDGANQGVNIFG